MIRSATVAETPLVVDYVVDSTHIRLTSAVSNNWLTSENPVLEKTINQQWVQGIYLGEPAVIPMYPAITISAKNASSEWLTIDSTKETYNIDINVYVNDANQETAYRQLLTLTDQIRRGLKKNIFPLVGPYNTTSLTSVASYPVTDPLYRRVLNVANSSIFSEIQTFITIEDKYKNERNMVKRILSPTQIELNSQLCFDYLVPGTTLIVPTRFIYNSWPADTSYGTIFKGTFLKAATISWFAWEEEPQDHPPMDDTLYDTDLL
jgi:hypothetical protein